MMLDRVCVDLIQLVDHVLYDAVVGTSAADHMGYHLAVGSHGCA